MFAQLGRRMFPADDDLGKALVVAQQHVEARLQLLDQVDLQQQGVGLGAGGGEFHGPGQIDHQGDALGVEPSLGVLGDALLQGPRLAHIEGLAVGGEHPIDTGRVGEATHFVPNQGGGDKGRRGVVGHGGEI